MMKTGFHNSWIGFMVLALAFFVPSWLVRAEGTIAPALSSISSSVSNSDSLIQIVILLNDDSERASLASLVNGKKLSRADRLKQVTQRLQAYRSPASAALEEFFVRHSIDQFEAHWIIPAYSVMVPLSLLDDLAGQEGVSLIAPDASITFDQPVKTSPAPQTVLGVSDPLQMINVPQLWHQGYTGKGRLVCSFDTGVDSEHPALAGSWRGNFRPLEEAWFSTIDPTNPPSDKVGHGTHTMGTMIGSVAADSFGVAPDAQWIAAGVVDQGKSLSATFSDILKAYEWALNPDGDINTSDDVPDVILNSWGVPKGMFAPCDDMFWGVIDNVEAAGIVAIFAAGNEGPDPKTIRSPADRSSTPFNTFSVGAVDNNKVVTDFSSRGPSSCDANQIKPEVMAPGVSIRSSTKGGGFLSMSGTSMAAPFVAGLVALARQYNPDATPTEIKQAMILAAEDLGAPGEDNAYGYGFIDAARMLEYLPAPAVPDFSIVEVIISDNEELTPGSTRNLYLEVRNSTGMEATLFARLTLESTGSLELLTDRAPLVLVTGNTVATNLVPFVLAVSESAPHGEVLYFTVSIEKENGLVVDTISLELIVGHAPSGGTMTHEAGSLVLTVSDFGQIGLAEGSIYNVGGEGFRLDGGENLLYEAGIFVGRSGYDLSSSVRDLRGEFRESDFTPVEQIASEWLGADDGYHSQATFADRKNTQALALEIRLETVNFSHRLSEDIVLMRYELTNSGSSDLDSVYFGFVADFDLLGATEAVYYSDSLNMIYQVSPEGPMVGLVMLENLASATTIINGSGKAGLTNSEMIDLVALAKLQPEQLTTDDLYFAVGSRSLRLKPDQSVTVTLALVAGHDLHELHQNGALARVKYQGLNTGYIDHLPGDFTLEQNYPNPFNPTTLISFTLEQGQSVRLEVINILGQTVKSYDLEALAPGRHEIVWDGTNGSGHEVASGLYLYRLIAGGISETRKMVLLR